MRTKVLPGIYAFLLLSSLFITPVHAQPCNATLHYTFGEPGKIERGYSLVAAPDNKTYYVTGLKADSVFLLQLDKTGRVLFTRTFDIVPGKKDHANMIFMDHEGMLLFTGMTNEPELGGSVIVMKYDVANDEILWSKEFVTAWNRNYNYSIIQLGPGGNYVIANNPHYNANGNDDSELIELDRNTGQVIPALSKVYDVEGSETMSQIIYHEGFIYGSGRYTSAGSTQFMRNTLTKIDPQNGNTIWAVLGHRSHNDVARLYGVDLVIHDDLIYSMTTGDPSGVSGTNWKVYMQCQTLEGELVWINEYAIPGNHDYGLEVAYSDNGIVALVHQRNAISSFMLFKINLQGKVLWANQFPATTVINTAEQLIALDDKLVFTATTADGTIESDILLVQTNLNGIPDNPCVSYQKAVVTAVEVNNPVFYEVTPTVAEAEYDINNPKTKLKASVIVGSHACSVPDTVESNISVTICDDESYEGYSESGVYVDHFTTSGGCDSIRTLHLVVEVCQPDCGTLAGNIYGEAFVEENAHCLFGSKLTNAVYIAGVRDDRTLLVKMDYNGQIVWAREFDILPEEDEIPAGLIEDSEGMVVLVGTGRDFVQGGTLYGMRYDPNTNIILWSREYTHSPNDYSFGVIEKGPGGNYLLNNQATYFNMSHNYAEVMEIDRTTGTPVPTFAKNYQIIGTETLFELAYDNGSLFGVGRYKDGGVNEYMRHTLVQLDPSNGNQLWVKMGHKGANQDARLYGTDLVVFQNSIFSIYRGDPNGTSTTNTKTYAQRTNLKGNLIWLKQYELPGNADYTIDIVASQGGLVILNFEDVSNTYYLFKIDPDGNLLWSRAIVFNGVGSAAEQDRSSTRLIEAGNQLFFTGFGTGANGDRDLVVVRTDLEGNVKNNCLESIPANITVHEVKNITWYDKDVIQFDVEHSTTPRTTVAQELTLLPSATCGQTDTLFTQIEAIICEGSSYESYTQSGIYQDTFQTEKGCDSIRTLTLTVLPAIQTELKIEICTGASFEGYTLTGIYRDTFSLMSGCDSIRTLQLTVYSCQPVITYDLDLCRSYMSDGSIMDYSEFDPEYPNPLHCGEVEATNLFRTPPQENKHSCTEGLGGTLAMCISALNNCTYSPGHAASAIMEFTLTPDTDSSIAINGLEFYEKAPPTYSWIDGPSGLNNYPRYYGIRILKNGIEVFEQHDISTSLTWALQSYDLNSNDAFTVSSATTFRIELLPYCPVGNGATVSAWDLEDIRIIASCVPPLPDDLIISGTITTWNHTPVFPADVYLSEDESFSSSQKALTNSTGEYVFQDLRRYASLYLKGEKDTDLLRGVSTLDLLTLQKHLLGKQSFTSLDQYIAGDVNHSGTLSAMDLLDLQKTLLGIHTRFPNNTSWRIGIEPLDLSSTDLKDFREVLNIKSLFEPRTTVNMIGVKVGDVNRDVDQALNQHGIEQRSNESFPLHLEEKDQNNVTTILFKAGEGIHMEGMQLALIFQEMEILEVRPAALPVTRSNFYVDQNGILRISFTHTQALSISPHELLFSVSVRSNTHKSVVEKIETIQDVLAAEIYTPFAKKSILLTPHLMPTPSISGAPLNFEIIPNPFKDQFQVEFSIPTDGWVKFEVFTPLGELVYASESELLAGDHTEVIQLDKWKGVKTILWCRLIYGTEMITRKAVKWE